MYNDPKLTHASIRTQDLEVIDDWSHLSELEPYELTDRELGELAYYEALGELLADQET